MSELTRQEVLAKKRARYARAGKEHKAKILDELVELFGYHRKAAIRALRPRGPVAAPFVRGRPKEYDPAKLLPPLKAIWLAALQPCGERLKACLPDWLPAYEQDHRQLDPDVRQALLDASRATLDRLLIPARVAHRRRAATRPGGLLRAEIPLRTEWAENAPGYLEMDTVALCGGSLDDRHGWMFDAVDIHTTWSVLRGLPNRSEASVCGQLDDVAARLPFPLRGLGTATTAASSSTVSSCATAPGGTRPWPSPARAPTRRTTRPTSSRRTTPTCGCGSATSATTIQKCGP